LHGRETYKARCCSCKNRNSKKAGTITPFLKKVLIIDDDPDITLAFKLGLDSYYYYYENKRRFEVYIYNNPLVALSEFKPNFYDLLLTDVNMPHINGFELSQEILELDSNIKVCYMSAVDVNIESLRQVYPKVSFGSFIKKSPLK